MEQKFYIARHLDNEVWKKSSSGGAFTALTDVWFESYGDFAVIYGCALDENLSAIHIRANNTKNRDLCRGSKYIQSDIIKVYSKVAEDLKSNLKVLFSGTPCQISAIKGYLDFYNVPRENLLTVDFVCHGVGSNHFFEDYVSNLEKKYNSKAISCNFRAKSRPGKIQDMEILFENSRKYNAASTKYDWFYSAYIKNLILRPSCFNCPFASVDRISDITIADNWCLNTSYKEKAKSLIIVNSALGDSLVSRAFENMENWDTGLSEVHQPHLHAPCKKPANYADFWNLYEKDGYLTAQKYIGNYSVKGRCKSLFAYVLYKFHLIEFFKSFKERLK